MSVERKQLYFHMTVGYIGVMLLILTGLRFVMIGDSLGHALALVSLLFMGFYWRYVETNFIPETIGTRIVKRVFMGVLVIIFLVGSFQLIR